jgi:signal transduction histidine kinase/HAMP domain-containing protein
MNVRLQTKITILITLLVLAVVGVSSALYVATLTRQVIRQSENRADEVSKQVLSLAEQELIDAPAKGLKLSSNSPEALHAYVLEALQPLSRIVRTDAAENPDIDELAITDSAGVALVSSLAANDPSHPRTVLPRPPLSQLVNSGFIRQLRIIYGPPQSYATSLPFKVKGDEIFGEIRVTMEVALLRNEITPALRSAAILAIASILFSVLLAAVVSSTLLRPVERISAQLDRISRGEVDERPLNSADEFGQVSTKISQIGQELSGVREIFSNLRENLDQFLGGLEDGLLLFTRDGRAVMVSPAVERFLGESADQLLGRHASEIFPAQHPFRAVLGLSGNRFEPVAAAEIVLDGAQPGLPPQRIEVSVQVSTEGGALVRLRDPEPREGIGLQLQVSERLSALGKATKGVAHEVKNPLNSMRIWLENLKENLPAGEELPRQAVAVLDSEIDRLDSVVKRLLDFMTTPDLRLEETSLESLLTEIAGIARPQMERAGVRLETNFIAIPPVRVDQALIKQALLNLIINAIEAMPEGGVLTLTLARSGDSAQIRVSDTGRGIAPEHRSRIFQLFFTTRKGGSGIGLAIAYKAVQLQDGTIDFETEVGRGTTFRIELPLAQPIEHAFGRAPDLKSDAKNVVARNPL